MPMLSSRWYKALVACVFAAATVLCIFEGGLLRPAVDDTGLWVAPASRPVAVAGVALLQRNTAIRKDVVHLRGSSASDLDGGRSSHGGLAEEALRAEQAAKGLLSDAESLFRGADKPKTSTGSYEASYNIERLLAQLAFGVLYYFLIASKYPTLPEGLEANEEAERVMRKGEISATWEASGANCCHAFCCSAPRAAQTYHSAGIMNYWLGLFSMSLLPCCTLWAVNYWTELPQRLGGKKKDCCMSCCCTLFCSCCVITQEAEALDQLTGAKSSLCSVNAPEPPEMRS